MRVALHFQSNRHATIQEPLEAVGVGVALNPAEFGEYDAVICGSPGLLSDHWRFDGPVVYRLRGNLWEERAGHLVKPRSWVKDRMFSRLCDGALTPDSRLDALLRRRTNVSETAVVGLPIDRHDWPTVAHNNHEIRALTLTNFDYEKKIEPLYSFTTTADAWLAENGGRWVVCGDGDHADAFADHAGGLDHVEYRGYQPAREVLAESNVMIHPSNMDIQTPNAVLEGVASNLPVILSDSKPFDGQNVTLSVSCGGLGDALAVLENPTERRWCAGYGWDYLKQHHAHEHIGEDIRGFLEGLL
jgi:glycosyltransferase involved in cell wall biosynthesis